jgi:hypothetical protein
MGRGASVGADMTGDFLFVGLTDDDSGFVGEIESFLIPDIGCSSQMWHHGPWPKMGVFLADLHGLTGMPLFVDRNSFICCDLTQFVERFQAEPQAAFDATEFEQVWVEKHASSMEYWLG